VAWTTSSRPHDNDCLCLPSTPSPRNREAGEKESMDRHHSQAYPPCAVLSSLTSLARGLRAVRTAANGSARHSLPCNHSAKVVLVCRHDWSGRLTADPRSVECCRGHKSWHASRCRTVELLCDIRDSHAAEWPTPTPRMGLRWTSSHCLVCAVPGFVGDGTRGNSVGLVAPGSGPAPCRSEQ
jgi:hypothetical protein